MSDLKPILALETSANLCSVCSYFNEEKYFEVNINMKYSHAEKLFQLADTVLKLSGLGLRDYQGIAVSAGPGSFTGLRIGFSAAKGLAVGAGLPIIVVPTFEALALYISAQFQEDSDFIIANKVNTTEIYYARFHVKSNSYIFAENLQIVTTEEFSQKSKDIQVFGNVFTAPAKITTPPGNAIARWAQLRGEVVHDYNFVEPNYMKNFIIKEKKK